MTRIIERFLWKKRTLQPRRGAWGQDWEAASDSATEQAMAILEDRWNSAPDEMPFMQLLQEVATQFSISPNDLEQAWKAQYGGTTPIGGGTEPEYAARRKVAQSVGMPTATEVINLINRLYRSGGLNAPELESEITKILERAFEAGYDKCYDENDLAGRSWRSEASKKHSRKEAKNFAEVQGAVEDYLRDQGWLGGSGATMIEQSISEMELVPLSNNRIGEDLDPDEWDDEMEELADGLRRVPGVEGVEIVRGNQTKLVVDLG